MAQWVKNLTAASRVTVEVQVQSLPWLRELKVWYCYSCSCGSDSVPDLGISTYLGSGHKTKKKDKVIRLSPNLI